MAKTALLKLDEKEYPLPVIEGTEGEKAIDTRQLRAVSGYIAYVGVHYFVHNVGSRGLP